MLIFSGKLQHNIVGIIKDRSLLHKGSTFFPRYSVSVANKVMFLKSKHKLGAKVRST
jgi:hypothetical protein